MPIVTESMVEDAALDWFRALGYQVQGGPDMSPGPDSLYYPLRASHADAVLTSAVRGSLRRLNSGLPEEALDDALHRLTRRRVQRWRRAIARSTAWWWTG